MSYRIAVGSSDGKNVDLKFGEVQKFLIFSVDDGRYSFSEIRPVEESESQSDCHTCGAGNGSGSGCSMGNGQGCNGPAGLSGKIDVISDCRCIVCSKVGFQAQKQLEKKAISVFDVECPVAEALEKITYYYDRVDNHLSLRK